LTTGQAPVRDNFFDVKRALCLSLIISFPAFSKEVTKKQIERKTASDYTIEYKNNNRDNYESFLISDSRSIRKLLTKFPQLLNSIAATQLISGKAPAGSLTKVLVLQYKRSGNKCLVTLEPYFGDVRSLVDSASVELNYCFESSAAEFAERLWANN